MKFFGGHDTKEISTKTLSINHGSNSSAMQHYAYSTHPPHRGLDFTWSPEALCELKKIPEFVRGKVKQNTEKFAKSKDLNEISLETLYKAKQSLQK